MAYTVPFTAATGATILASGWNTSARDNIISIWVYTTAGDIVYATSATALARLGIGAARTVLTSSGTAPQWSLASALKGIPSTWGYVRFAPAQAFTGAQADVSGASIMLTLPAGVGYTATYSVLLLASIMGYTNNSGTGYGFWVTGSVAGVIDPNAKDVYNGSQTEVRNEGLGYHYEATGVASGSCQVKLRCEADSGKTNVVTSGHMFAVAFAE